MSQLNPVKNASSPDQIYYDITVSNFQSTVTKPPVFFFNEQRNNPFIMNPEDYYLSILRFTLETGSLPVFIPSIQPNQADVNKTIYSFTMEYTYPPVGVAGSTVYTSAQTFVDWIPQDFAAQVPLPPSANINRIQNNATGYYNCYSYSYWIYLCDLAMNAAFEDLRTQVIAVGGAAAFPTTYSPFINWDTTSDQAVIYADEAAFTVDNRGINVDNIRIYMNAPMYGIFNSFPAVHLGYSQATLGRNFQLIIANVGAINLVTITPVNPPPAPAPQTFRAIATYQENSTVANWSPITALVFTSNTLPIQSNQVSTPVIYDDNEIITFGGNNANIANIITDMVSDNGQYRPNVVYEPRAEYRLVTLYGNRPLSNVDLSIFWRSKTGELIPYRINSGEAVTIKLAFLKKEGYNDRLGGTGVLGAKAGV